MTRENATPAPPTAPPAAPTAAIVIIGNEVLSGRTQDVNVNYLAGELTGLGIRLVEVRIVADAAADIVAAVNACRQRHSYVFTTGGIGGTHDDITARCIAQAFGREYCLHPGAEKILRAHYGADLNEARLAMARMPAGATLIENPVSGAPGFRVENVFVLAGVPVIARAMFEGVRGQLTGGPVTLSKSLHTNLTEGVIATAMGRVQDSHPAVEIGSYPFFRLRRFGVNLVVRGHDVAAIDAAIAELRAMIEGLGGTADDGESTGEPLS